MFIKLTKFDNRPVWLNASFIVTVEPRREGAGAVVVPIGDGLDYDVRESPEEVLRKLEGAPTPTVVPVPVSDCLTKTPSDVSPERKSHRDESMRPPRQMPAPRPQPPSVQAPVARAPAVESPVQLPKEAAVPKASEEKPAAATSAEVGAQAAPAGTPPLEDLSEVKIEPKGTKARKRTTRGKSARATAKKEKEPAEQPPPRAELELSNEEIVRLRKLAPKSLAKLKNTLATQFQIADVGATVTALAAKGELMLDGNHVNWKSAETDW